MYHFCPCLGILLSAFAKLLSGLIESNRKIVGDDILPDSIVHLGNVDKPVASELQKIKKNIHVI